MTAPNTRYDHTPECPSQYEQGAGCTCGAKAERRTRQVTAPDDLVPHWDHKIYDRSVLSDYDQRCLPYAISGHLHHVTGIPPCGARKDSICAMCGSAVRLVLQAAEPRIIDALIKKMAGSVGRGNINLNPRLSDD